VFLVVASVVGSGIFLAPSVVADLLPHPGFILLAWFVGGLLSLAGALANAELGAMFPRAGGDYVYLRHAWHPLAGFLVGWLSFFAIYAGTIATLAAGLAEAVAPFWGLDDRGKLLVAVGATIASSAINYVGLRAGVQVNNVTSIVKIAALAVFVVAGPLAGGGDWTRLRPLVAGIDGIEPMAFGLALSPVLFSYLGWNAPVYVASEIRQPSRNLPLSLFIGLGICTALYMLMNVVYLYTLPLDHLRGEADAGRAAAEVLFGPLGGRLVAMLVIASIIGTLHATIIVGPRIVYAMALDDLFLASAERVHAVYRTPHGAIVLQALIAVVLLLLLRSFPRVLDFTTFGIVLATIADTAALYALRRREPDRPRPYRAWGYPAVPAIFLVANVAIAGALLYGRPIESGAGLLVIATGVPAYVLFARRARQVTPARRRSARG
jgi:basic amino acid/polyamine antiporter, APA family